MTRLNMFVVLISFFIHPVLRAATCEVRTGLHGEEKLCWSENLQGWISQSCVRNKSCEALKHFAKNSLLPKGPSSSHNQGSLLCQRLGNRVVILRDKSSGEQSFCSFKDRSLVSTGLLDQKNL
ncbi:MAG TPA: hypothetical protein VNJ01_17285 [Bacteriovoracaceae bacterium]|nr:hypothetical protein [Bacteriovoracaceae bacterium]